MSRSDVLVDADWVQAHLDDVGDTRVAIAGLVLDVRSLRLGALTGRGL